MRKKMQKLIPKMQNYLINISNPTVNNNNNDDDNSFQPTINLADKILAKIQEKESQQQQQQQQSSR